VNDFLKSFNENEVRLVPVGVVRLECMGEKSYGWLGVKEGKMRGKKCHQTP